MSRKVATQILVALVLAAFLVQAWWAGGSVTIGWAKFYSGALSVVAVATWLYEHWLWKTKPFQQFRLAPPNVSGTWKGMTHSTWVNPETLAPPPPIPTYLCIRQTASDVTVKLMTQESSSNSVAAAFNTSNGDRTLDYTYRNVPRPGALRRSPQHQGATTLLLVGRPVERMSGTYWTDRKTLGELIVEAHRSGHADDFIAAEALFT